MFAATTTQILTLSIIGLSVALMLRRLRGVPEVYWISGGVVLLLGLRLIHFHLVWQASGKAADVCFFLIGMMLLCELAREHGVFDWVSGIAVQRADGSCLRLFALVYAIGTIVTVFLSNDATAVVLTPAILTAVRKARVPPMPYLFACAFIANAASFLLPISNPANLVVFHDAMPPLAGWLAAFAVPCLLSILTTFFVLRRIFRKDLCGRIHPPMETSHLNGNGRFVLASAAAMIGVLLIASSLGRNLGLPTCISALVLMAAICIKERSSPLLFLKEISWETLWLVVGLFIMVDAAESAQAMQYTQHWLSWVQHFGAVWAQFVTAFGVGIANNFVNNLPLGLIAGNTLSIAHASRPIANAVLIGADLGPNLSITGSLATILWLIALKKEGLDVSFWDFLRVGVLAMPIALSAAIGGEILMQTLFR